MSMYNHAVDVAFVVEGPWEKPEDIPYEVLLAGMKERIKGLRRYPEHDAFYVYDTVKLDEPIQFIPIGEAMKRVASQRRMACKA